MRFDLINPGSRRADNRMLVIAAVLGAIVAVLLVVFIFWRVLGQVNGV
jgi:hypothetical protein